MLQEEGATSSPQQRTAITTHLPKLPNFSGDKKDETSYDLWRYEVECLMRYNVKYSTVLQSFRRSLRGNAARVLMRLGTEASIDDILQRIDGVYGTVEDNENLLSQFYSASQKENEDVLEWSCRLEDLLNKVIRMARFHQQKLIKCCGICFGMVCQRTLRTSRIIYLWNLQNSMILEKPSVRLNRINLEGKTVRNINPSNCNQYFPNG